MRSNSASSGRNAAATRTASSAPFTSPDGEETRDQRLELALGVAGDGARRWWLIQSFTVAAVSPP